MDTAVVGQERALDALRSAAARPGHAYLLVGPRGSGVEDAARLFAALLIGVADDERGQRLVARGVHPDVVEFEPAGASYRVKDDVRDRILPEAARAPIEGDRKVLVIFEAERLRGNQNESANAMLKTIEEPPERTVVVLVTSAPDDLLPTIRSRCQRLTLRPLADADLSSELARRLPDMSNEERQSLVRLAGGSIGAALELASDDGIALAGEAERLIDRASTPDITATLALAEKIARMDDGLSRFGAFLLSALSDRVRARARRGDGHLRRWVDLCEKLSASFNRSDALHLDPRQTVLSASRALWAVGSRQ